MSQQQTQKGEDVIGIEPEDPWWGEESREEEQQQQESHPPMAERMSEFYDSKGKFQAEKYQRFFNRLKRQECEFCFKVLGSVAGKNAHLAVCKKLESLIEIHSPKVSAQILSVREREKNKREARQQKQRLFRAKKNGVGVGKGGGLKVRGLMEKKAFKNALEQMKTLLRDGNDGNTKALCAFLVCQECWNIFTSLSDLTKHFSSTHTILATGAEGEQKEEEKEKESTTAPRSSTTSYRQTSLGDWLEGDQK